VSRMANPLWRPDQRKVVGSLRSMIARYEETRERPFPTVPGCAPPCHPRIAQAFGIAHFFAPDCVELGRRKSLPNVSHGDSRA
jgi:hypothetical protein